jgi:hypothetical protein
MCGPAKRCANACQPVPRGVADRWDPHDVTLASPVTSPSSTRLFPFHWRRRAKAPGSPPWRPRGVPPRAAAASWSSTCPCAPAAISSHAAGPRGSPNPSRLEGESSPVHTATGEEEGGGEGGEEESKAVRGNAVRREDRSRPWEEPDPPSSSARASSASASTPPPSSSSSLTSRTALLH